MRSNGLATKNDIIAAAPALLLCAATLAMLILDIAVYGMGDSQYVLYPLLIKIAGFLGLACTALCFSAGLCNGRLHPDAGVICFAGFLVCIFISTCINGFSREALLGVQFRYIGVFDILSFFLAYMLCSSRIREEGLRRSVLTAVTAVSFIIAVVFLIDTFFPFVNAFRNKNEPAAIFFHGNHYGYFLVIAVILSAGLCIKGSRLQRLYGAVSFTLNTVALICNSSTGCLLAAGSVIIAGAVFVSIKDRKKRKEIAFLAVMLAVLAVLALKMNPALVKDVMMDVHDATDILKGGGDTLHGHGRWGLWKQTAEMIKERPVFGYGCEGISEILAETNVSANPHCEVLTYAAFYGVPAAVLYSAGVVAAVIRGLKSHDHMSVTAACAAAGYFVSSMFGVSMFYTTPFFFVLLGIARGMSERSC